MTGVTVHDHNPSTYRASTRCCPLATEAYRLYRKRLREGRQPAAHVPAIGPARRLQALVAAGYNWHHLASLTGMTTKGVTGIAFAVHTQVHRRTADKIRAVYDRLSLIPGPSTYARTVAGRYGFRPPLAWDDAALDDPNSQPYQPDPNADSHIIDREAIRRALAGDRINLTVLEKHHAVHHGRAAGMTLGAIATVLHMSYGQAQGIARTPIPTYELAA